MSEAFFCVLMASSDSRTIVEHNYRPLRVCYPRYSSSLIVFNALGSLMKWLFFKKPDQSTESTLKERTRQTVRVDQVSETHRGPKGGLYRIDAKEKI